MHSLLIVSAALAASPAAGSHYQGVLLEFSASWCGPCREMSPLVDRLERQGYPIRKVDVDRERALANKYGISSIPAFVLVVNGKEVSRQVGRQSESQLKRLLAQIPRRSTPSKASIAENRTNPPRMPSAPPGSDMAATETPKRGLFSGIKLPTFGSKRKQPEPPTLGDSRAIFRGNSPNRDSDRVVRVGPMAASTRIRIKDAKGLSYGSGTIIESRPGLTLVLTCGHIFRDLTDDSLIEVDIFDAERAETYVGKVLRFDLEADVGLITIASDVALPHVKVGELENGPKRNESVFSIGCGGGDTPTRQNIRVTKLNPYLGPDCLECTGVPVQGRSGGGLFNKQGEVIGVCFASDAKAGTGLYAGLQPIHDLLKEKKATPKASPTDRLAKNAGRNSSASLIPDPQMDQVKAGSQLPMNDADIVMDAAAHSAPGIAPAVATAPRQRNDPLAGVPKGAEVVCIIRSHENPRETSRVVIINRASPKFLAYLRGELEGQPQPTTARLPMTANESPVTRRTAHFVDPKVVVASADANQTRTGVHLPHKEKAGATPRWRPTRRTPVLAASPDQTPQRYRRSSASRR